MSKKKTKFRVIVVESQCYEVFVDAKDEETAREIAEENYGCDGVISSTLVEVPYIYKVK